MLELRRYDPDGEEFSADAYVFGNEVGERLKNYQKAWSTLRLRALGHGPHWGPNGRFLPRATGENEPPHARPTARGRQSATGARR
jgi:hypothetical protein